MTSNKKNRSDHQNNKNGFSLTEVIIVISILGIILSVSFATLGKSNEQLSLKQAQADIFFALEEAQNRAATGFGGVTAPSYGVRIVSDGFFSLTKTGVNITEGAKTDLPAGIFTNKTDTNIIFKRITGSTDGDTIITLTHISGGTKTINITSNGKISMQ